MTTIKTIAIGLLLGLGATQASANASANANAARKGTPTRTTQFAGSLRTNGMFEFPVKDGTRVTPRQGWTVHGNTVTPSGQVRDQPQTAASSIAVRIPGGSVRVMSARELAQTQAHLQAVARMDQEAMRNGTYVAPGTITRGKPLPTSTGRQYP